MLKMYFWQSFAISASPWETKAHWLRRYRNVERKIDLLMIDLLSAGEEFTGKELIKCCVKADGTDVCVFFVGLFL